MMNLLKYITNIVLIVNYVSGFIHIKNTTIDSSQEFALKVKEDILNIDKYGDWYNIVSPKLHVKSRLFNKYI